MRKYPTEAKSLLGEWLRVATPEMRDDLCRRVPCPLNSLHSLSYGLRKMPRLDRGVAIVNACNAIREEAIKQLAQSNQLDAAVIPPMMTLQALIDGVNRNDR